MHSEQNCPANEAELDELLSQPSERLVAFFQRFHEKRLAILGIGGKIGVTLGMAAARAARLASSDTEVLGVSRFSDTEARKKLEDAGLTTIACDLLDESAVRALPDVDDVVFMAGRKFGTSGESSLTWAMNTIVPVHVAERYPHARTVVFSTGCVYPLVAAESGGCDETCEPSPIGEYAQSTLARERVFEHCSRTRGTPVLLFRLNYAIDLRYGVLHDIATQVWEEKPIDLSVRSFNCIWQGDVIERALLALDFCGSPPSILNVSGPEMVSTRAVAEYFSKEFHKPLRLINEEKTPEPAYLCDARRSFASFGYPAVTLEHMLALTAVWIRQGGSSLRKPTHFQTTDGKY